MDADPRMPFGAPSASPALASRRTRRASTQTRGNSTTLSTAVTLPHGPHQRRSSLQIQAQQHGAHIHQADSPNCRCTACHLKTAVFPRRRDGRIVLPIPWDSPSDSAEESRPPPQFPSGSGELENHVPNVVGTRSDDYALHNWGRSSEGSSIRNAQVERHTDRGEGTSRGVPRLSGPGVAPSEELPSQPSHLNVSDNVETKRRRSNTDRSKSYRYPKPYGRPAEQGELVAHTAGPEHFESSYRPGIDPSAVYLYHPSSLVTTTQPSSTEMESRRGPSQSTFNSSTSSHPQSFSQGALNDRRFSILSTSTQGSRPNLDPPNSPLDRRYAQSASWHSSRNESQAGTTPQLQPPSSLDSPWDQTRNIRFSTHSQSSTLENAHKLTSHTTGPSRQTNISAPTSAPSSSSFTWRPGDDEEENVIRFQEPVVHDPTNVSDQQEGQVEIKWDTERKRRQGYFSQTEEGSEKSNFRLYNQSTIDFGS